MSMASVASSTFALQSAPADRAAAREYAHQEMKRMSEAMIEEKGLLNHAQAGLLLDVSTKRVGELVRLGKLTDFTFLGRKYVSMREIWARNQQELKAGRPPMPRGKQIKVRLKAAFKHDSLQVKQGGFQGPYQKKLRKEAKERQRLKNMMRGIREGGKK